MNNNKLIAEFMGLVVSDSDNYTSELHTNVDADLKYHTSWDWLMPVVQKVSSLCDEPYELDNMKHALLTGDIESVYDDVVEFINEHNKYICGSCGDHVNEVVFNKDSDVDECTNCTEYYER